MHQLSQEDQELAAKAIWMTTFEVTLSSCREKGLSSEATMVGMVTTMTTVIRELFKTIREESN